ncbi:uncharacterized protein LOC112053072 [Bicyclus anynana]|uniref:Uncharacterized protein LOC112053072 n=1 Tax=Bicyclus anynana TaxID=110368 RepID=A0A6J1NXF0_BICAN|nr:uncharacterized protein LOC112053072 [Bicyclus anynana]
MRTLLWTACLCSLSYAADGKSLAERIDARNVADDFDGKLSFKEGEYFHLKTIRKPRLSDSSRATGTATRDTKASKLNVPLVKKPIPKFADGGSDEDYQAKLKFPKRVSDSVEHEDEDFDVDDYDFDVDHDEFAGRGKPLQPRVKARTSKIKKARPAPVLALRPVGDVAPRDAGKPSVKVARKAGADKMKEEEYDEEFTAGTKTMEIYRKSNSKNTASDEGEDSKEEKSNRPTRTARSSPLSFGAQDRLGEKKGEIPKILSYLPLFSLSTTSLDREQEELPPKTIPGFVRGVINQFK